MMSEARSIFGASFPGLSPRVCHFGAKCTFLKEFVHCSATESSIVEKCLGNFLLFNALPVPLLRQVYLVALKHSK